MTDANPLLRPWTGPFEAPPFEAIRPAHYRPAFEAALADHAAEIGAIAGDAAVPTFENTIVALERAGASLDKVCAVFFNLSGSDTDEAIQAVEREMAPILSRHSSAIYLDAALYRRIDDLWSRRDALALDPEQARVLERYHTVFARAGGGLPEAAKARLAAIGERLATLGTQFGQNLLADERDYQLVLEEGDLAGLPEPLVAAAAAAAEARGRPGRHVITLSRSSVEPFLQFSARRDLREAAFAAWAKRGENGGATDNRAIIAETIALRAERAKLLGYPSFAAFRLADTMAKTPEAARGLLQAVWEPAKARAGREGAALQLAANAEGGNFTIEPWDWRYYAERRRQSEFDLDEAEIKPYFQLDQMIEAAFYTAGKLFGLSFVPRPDIPLYHSDARAWEVRGATGVPLALFIGDYFARASKRSGAWMSGFRSQQRLDGLQPQVTEG